LKSKASKIINIINEQIGEHYIKEKDFQNGEFPWDNAQEKGKFLNRKSDTNYLYFFIFISINFHGFVAKLLCKKYTQVLIVGCCGKGP
jgi:hypothetical protein